MKRVPLRRISVRVTVETEAPAMALLEAMFGQPASVYVEARTGRRTASVYLEDTGAWQRADGRRLLEGLRAACGRKFPAGAVRVETLPAEDWADSWKRHFKPFAVGTALLVKPSWSRRRARHGQAVVVLDPGLSFGTGQHPTTRFCLEQIVDFSASHPGCSFLDIGTGSGILAIAAAKLGCRPVEAFDFDPDAVRVARANARVNGAGRRIQFARADLTELPARAPRRFDLVCANLTPDLLLSGQRRILARLAPDGRLVLAGILRGQFAAVRGAFASAGMRRVAQARAQEWHSGAFERAV